jgi:dihydropteroate synthase
MGILNLTPDSFSDGGAHPDPVAAGFALLEAGADIVDIGGESTRPGALPVAPEEEQRRILPAVAALSRAGAKVSVDTRHASTMAAALGEGAQIINDVSGLRHDPHAAPLLACHACQVVIMHMRGTPQTMVHLTQYEDVVADVRAELCARVAAAIAAGIARDRIIIDPGIGFAKTAKQNVALLRGLPAFADLALPILVGVSRKGFIGDLGGEPRAARRAPGSMAAALFATMQGASLLRVHDVTETRQALRVWHALSKDVLF